MPTTVRSNVHGLKIPGTGNPVHVRHPGQNVELNGSKPAAVWEGERQGVPALVAVEGVRPPGQGMGEPEVLVRWRERLLVRIAEAEEEAVAAGLEGLVEGEVVQPLPRLSICQGLHPRMLDPGAQYLDDGVVIPVPEGPHRELAPVEGPILQRGADGGGDALLDEGRVAHHRLVDGEPVGPGRPEEGLGSGVDEGVRSQRGGGLGASQSVRGLGARRLGGHALPRQEGGHGQHEGSNGST